MSRITIGTLLRSIAAIAYLASLALPPYKTLDPHMEELGITILLFGWISVFGLTSWLANPLIIYCLFRMNAKPYLCSILSTLALLAAHDFNKVKSLGWDSGGEIYYGTVTGLNYGCYLWLSSLVLTLMASLACWINSRKIENHNAQAKQQNML